MRPRWLVLGLLLIPACATAWSVARAPAAREGCPPGPATESCFATGGGLLTTPLINAPGHILVVTGDGLRESHGMDTQPAPGAPFVIEELTLAGRADVAQGHCPRATEPARLAQLASGDVAIVCVGVESVAAAGVIDRARHAVDWRWRILVEGIVQGSDARVVELGETIGIVYPVLAGFPSPDRWFLALSDGSARDLDRDLELLEHRKIIALTSLDGEVRILFAGANDFAELTLGPHGATKMVRTEQQLGSFTAGTPSPDCVARGTDGAVTITVPTQRVVPLARVDRMTGTLSGLRSGTLTILYPNAALTNGADADPSADGRCVGVHDLSDEEPDDELGWWEDHPVRATRVGRRELIVYETPPGDHYRAALHVERR